MHFKVLLHPLHNKKINTICITSAPCSHLQNTAIRAVSHNKSSDIIEPPKLHPFPTIKQATFIRCLHENQIPLSQPLYFPPKQPYANGISHYSNPQQLCISSMRYYSNNEPSNPANESPSTIINLHPHGIIYALPLSLPLSLPYPSGPTASAMHSSSSSSTSSSTSSAWCISLINPSHLPPL